MRLSSKSVKSLTIGFVFCLFMGLIILDPNRAIAGICLSFLVFSFVRMFKSGWWLTKEYSQLKTTFKHLFNQELTDVEIAHKKGGMIGEEAMPLGTYIWDKSGDFVEYYVSWLPHYRGDCHGKIYKDGSHEKLDALGHDGPVNDDYDRKLENELKAKGLLII